MTRSAAELGIDLMSGEFFGNDPYPAFAWMRRHAPVFHDDANDLWALARYDDVKAAGTDTATFSSAGGIRPKFPGLPMMIDLDAPEHVRRRKLVSAGVVRDAAKTSKLTFERRYLARARSLVQA